MFLSFPFRFVIYIRVWIFAWILAYLIACLNTIPISFFLSPFFIGLAVTSVCYFQVLIYPFVCNVFIEPGI